MANGYSRQIQERIGAAAEGTVFVSSDFEDIADTETIRRNLNRLTQAVTLRRILKGVYEKPEYSEMLKENASTLESIALKSDTMNLHPGFGMKAVRTSSDRTPGTESYSRSRASKFPDATRLRASSRYGDRLEVFGRGDAGDQGMITEPVG